VGSDKVSVTLSLRKLTICLELRQAKFKVVLAGVFRNIIVS